MPPKRYHSRDLPISLPLVCQRGDTLRSPLFRHRDPVTNELRNLTGCTLAASGVLGDGTPVDLTPYLVLDLAGGRYRLIVPPTVSNGVSPWPTGLGRYKITLTDPLGVITTYFAGALGLKELDNDD